MYLRVPFGHDGSVEDLYVRSRYHGEGQVITSYIICGIWSLVLALDPCFWPKTPELRWVNTFSKQKGNSAIEYVNNYPQQFGVKNDDNINYEIMEFRLQ